MPYAGRPYTQTHPARLASVARLFGLITPAVESCRVLELGCASGDNLIPMAVAVPGARFTGVDLSARQVADGRSIIATLGLTNIELRQADIADINADFGEFDYIIANGVYSWVPPEIRDKVLAICHRNLAPNGVAYVSYKTLPGWGPHGVLRETMLFLTRREESAEARIRGARGVLEFLSSNLPAAGAYGALMRQEIESLRNEPDWYLFHDHLEDVSEPVYFHHFAAAAGQHGLQYLAEAEFSTMSLGGIARQTVEAMRRMTNDLVGFEQLTDIVRNRPLRQTLLVHGEKPVDRRLGGWSIIPFTIASAIRAVSRRPSLEHGAKESFEAPNGSTFSTSNAATKSALGLLIARWPLGLPFRELFAAARAELEAQGVARLNDAEWDAQQKLLGEELLAIYAGGFLDLRVWTPQVVAGISERPLASPIARLQATTGDKVTNLLHQRVTIDEFSRALLPLLDGSRDLDALAAALVRTPAAMQALTREGSGGSGQERPAADQMRAKLNQNLVRLAKAGLLAG
jgi:SAM-dependent methyltransferase